MSPNVRKGISYLAGALALILSTTLDAKAAGSAARKTNDPPDPATAQMAGPGVPEFGPVSYEVATITAYDFKPFAAVGDVSGIDSDGNSYIWASGGNNKGFSASVQIPAGVVIDYVGLRYCDTTANSAFTVNLDDIKGDSTFTVAINTTFPDSGCTTAYNPSAAGYNWDFNSTHSLDVILFQAGPDVAGQVKFRGAEVWYKRKVSPAPGTATFTDVPLSDFAFQFIEAFSSAAITVGCDPVGPKFCPDRNVTRREMAVFFAKALGLHFPN